MFFSQSTWSQSISRMKGTVEHWIFYWVHDCFFKGDYVCDGVYLFVVSSVCFSLSEITQNVMNGF